MNLTKYRSEARQQFDEVLLKTTNEILKEASSVLNRPVILQFKRQDQLRLLNLIAWSNKYFISLRELLVVLFKVWKGRYTSKTTKGLGVAVSTLTGPKSKQIIKDYIKKSYPNGENIELYKQDILNELLPSVDIKRREDPLHFLGDYTNYINAERKKIEVVEKKLKRRRWRTNPVY